MKRLYQKIYLTIIVALLVAVLVAGTVWRVAGGNRRNAGSQMLGVLVNAALPKPDASRQEQRRGLIELAAKLKLSLALYDEDRALIGTSDAATLPLQDLADQKRHWRHGVLTVRLPDQRYVVTRLPWPGRPPAFGLLAFLASVALAVGLCAYPVVRGLTRRLERLQEGVEILGSGNFKTRVTVEGRDEVARLAISFNKAAERIETLLGAHRQLLANASHELRTPLARLGMGIELAAENIEPERRAGLRRDLAELDDLIEEILTASRLDAVPGLSNAATVDLLALAAEECAAYDECTLDGEMVTIEGEARLLRRALRNLIENAQRYGKPPIEVTLKRVGNMAVLDVIDKGPGIPETERENIFTPFYRLDEAGKIRTSAAGTNDAASTQMTASGAGIGLALVRQIARRHGGDALVVPADERPSGDARNRIRMSMLMHPQ